MRKDDRKQLEKTVGDMTKEDLLEAYNVVRTKRGMDPIDRWNHPKEKLVERIERAERKRSREQNPREALKARTKARHPKKPKAKRRGVGTLVRKLLMETVGQTEDGCFPVGHAYDVILRKVRKQFPDSAVDAKHIRWYCTKMRERGVQPPVHRGRSHWPEGERG